MIRTKIIALTLSITVFTSCENKQNEELEKTPVKLLSQVFQDQLMKLIEAGSKLNSATDEGVNYTGYTSMLSDVRGSYSLAETMWPEGFDTNAKALMAEAVSVWNFEGKMWNKKIAREIWWYDSDAETALMQTPEDFRASITISNIDGSKGINPDLEIGKGMAYAGEKFKEARAALLAALSKS